MADTDIQRNELEGAQSLQNLTELDTRLGRRYFELLLEHVKQQRTLPFAARKIEIQYLELVNRLQQRFGAEPEAGAAIPTNIGRRLYAVKLICEKLRLPNLACLGVDADGQPGASYDGDWPAEKQAVLDFDWDAVKAELANAFEAETQAAVRRAAPRPKRRTETAALELLSEFWSQHQAFFGKVPYPQRERIVTLLRAGLTAEDAFFQVTGVRPA